MNINVAFVSIALAFVAASANAQGITAVNASPIYLKCEVANEPDGVNDMHIDFGTNILTDSFGTGYPFRIENPFLIAESFTEVKGKREVVITRRINRFTLDFQYIWPAQQIMKTGKCSIVEKKL
jgi:hypothetical protein